MIQTVIGGLCLAGGCAGLGWAVFVHLESRVRLLTAFVELCDRLSGELGFRQTPLPELGKRLGNPVLRRFWGFIEDKLGPCGGKTYSEAWKMASSELDLDSIDKSLISEIGDILGQYDAESQIKALKVLRGQLNISLNQAREKRENQGKMAGMLGVLCGVLLVIILL
ncbi:MAG: stage III sporulation protein AB [Oscillospiraceae bacterium]|nr:stage III sporulation protein AB [Oscillospiraceae bacterium]